MGRFNVCALGFLQAPRVGVQLDRPTGINDGLVKGHRYFDCPAGHGVLVKPERVTKL